MNTDLTLPARVALALNSAENEPKLIELARTSASIIAITNEDGYKQCHTARMALKTMRVVIEKTRKAACEDATAFSKGAIAEEKRLVAIIQPEEQRLERIQDAWDAAKEAEKQVRIEAELRRVTDLQERVAELRGNRMLTAGHGSKFIAEHISDVEGIPVDDSFEEFRQQAEDAKAAGLSWLRELHGAALAHEAEREELARLRAEQARRDAEERARIAEEERQAKLARDAEAARQAEQLRRQREELAEQERQQKAIRDAEEARLRAERAELERQQAEQRRQEAERTAKLQAERDAFERQQAEARRQQEEAETQQREIARVAAIKKPADTELIRVLADHYRVPAPKVHEWLRAMKLTQSDAA